MSKKISISLKELKDVTKYDMVDGTIACDRCKKNMIDMLKQFMEVGTIEKYERMKNETADKFRDIAEKIEELKVEKQEYSDKFDILVKVIDGLKELEKEDE